MKKLICALTIALAAVASNAASLNWSARIAGNDYIGDNMYIIMSTYAPGSWDNLTATDILNAAKGDRTSTTTEFKGYVDELTALGSANSQIALATLDNLPESAKSSASAYLVLVTDGKYWVSTTAYDVHGYVYSGTESATTWRPQTAAMALDSNGTWHNFQSVPEPTSGLLLLLGVAGLALKRKRA